MTNSTRRIAIVGGGPIGVEAALAFATAGHDVHLYERGQIGDAILQWGHVPLFSPWRLNTSPRGLAALAELGLAAPEAEVFPTGRQYVEAYLSPLTRHPLLAGRIHTGTRVVKVGRKSVLKGEKIGSATRRDHPFVLLLEDASGEESRALADVLIDASGTWGQANALGDAGIPAPGERDAAAAGRIEYRLPDLLGAAREAYAGKHTVLIGAGYSAATNLSALLQLARQTPGTRVTWLTRQAGAPYRRMQDDPLPERDRLSRLGNDAATGELACEGLRHLEGVHVEAIAAAGDQLTLTLEDADGATSTLEGVDRIIANVGFHPDPELTRELHLHQCYASDGPMKLAAALLAADGGGSGDCLTQGSLGPATLLSPEPDLFVLGARSYGRRSDFLIKLGLEQLADVATLLGG